MFNPLRTAIAVLGLIAASMPAVAANPPKVVFIGDYITANWPLPNSSWINLGVSQPSFCCATSGSSIYWIENFQQVIDLHPDIVHIMTGGFDAGLAGDGTLPIINSVFVQNIESMVAQLQAAGIKVILGVEIAPGPSTLGFAEMTGFLLQYGVAKGIPVINYANALHGYQNGQFYPPLPSGGSGSYKPQPYLTTANISGEDFPIPSAAGYALMTEMLQSSLARMRGAKVTSGYLQDVGFGMGMSNDFPTPVFNQNAVAPGYSLQFTPEGVYSDGVTRPLLNSDIAGVSGTWTSNNPLVMSVSRFGVAEALSPGTAWIFYTSPEGVGFSPWIMTVTSATPTP